MNLPNVFDLSDEQKKQVVSDSLKVLLDFHKGVGDILTKLAKEPRRDGQVDVAKALSALTTISIGHILSTDALMAVVQNADAPVPNSPAPKGTLLN